MRRVYLDNNATTCVDPRVVQAMLPYFTEGFGNASSKHAFGEAAGIAVRRARSQVRELIGAALDQEVIFTSGGTESDNAALLSALETQAGRDEIVTSTVEHPAILALCEHLEKTGRAKVRRIPVDGCGRIDVDAYRLALTPRTAIVSIMWANNETGTILPVAELAALAHQSGALFHTDAVQAAGKIPMQLQTTDIDMLSLSAHKLHGPKGIGALYVRKGVPFRPLIRGGRQERGRRAGTENTPAVIGFGEAAVLAAQCLSDQMARVRVLRDRLEHGLRCQFDDAIVIGEPDSRLPNTLNIAFESLESEQILMLLDREGIAASSGSACASGGVEVSHVLRAMRVPYTHAHAAVRLSLSRETTVDDVEAVLEVMPSVIAKLRGQAPGARMSAELAALDASYL